MYRVATLPTLAADLSVENPRACRGQDLRFVTHAYTCIWYTLLSWNAHELSPYESASPYAVCMHPCTICNATSDVTQNFYLFKILRAHILPLTNCGFNKSGDRFITGSYDRTCKVWNTLTGEELLTLEGHKNVVYAIAFNNPCAPHSALAWLSLTCSQIRRRLPFTGSATRSLPALSIRQLRSGIPARASCCTP